MVINDGAYFANAMTDVRTSRLQLHTIDVEEGERILARSAAPADAWADDFPFEGDVLRLPAMNDGQQQGCDGFSYEPAKTRSLVY